MVVSQIFLVFDDFDNLNSSVQFSCSVVPDSLWPHILQHTRLPSPSPTPGACSNSCPSSWWCHPTISSSVIPFSSCLQSFPASGSLLKLMTIELVMPSNHLILCHPLLLLHSIFSSIRVFSNEFFAWGAQSIGVSASASVLPMNIQDWLPLGLTGLISLQSKGLSKVFSNTTVQKHQFFDAHLSLYFEEYWLEKYFSIKVFPWDLYFQIIQIRISNEEHLKENQGGGSWALKSQDGLLYKAQTESLDTSDVSQEICNLNVGFPKSLWL